MIVLYKELSVVAKMKSKRMPRDKASLKCAPERRQSPLFAVLSRAVSINPILSLCYSLLPTTKTAHYAKEFVQLSRSKSLSRIASYCRRVPLHSGRNGGNISCSSRNVKAKSFKLVRVSQAFPFRVSDLCRIPFKSCKIPLVNWNRMPRLLFRLCNDPRLASVFPFAWNLPLNKAYIFCRECLDLRFLIREAKILRQIKSVCRYKLFFFFAQQSRIIFLTVEEFLCISLHRFNHAEHHRSDFWNVITYMMRIKYILINLFILLNIQVRRILRFWRMHCNTFYFKYSSFGNWSPIRKKTKSAWIQIKVIRSLRSILKFN